MTLTAQLVFGTYALAGRLATPLVARYLRRRVARGKEEPARLGERWGRAGQARPAGKLVWIHAASVGESLAVLPLLDAIRAQHPGLACLMTSGTVTSARLLAERLPAGVIHQFVPVDLPQAVGRFLDHWRPDLALFVESELWPTMLRALARRGTPLALVNARMSAGSFKGWNRVPGLAPGLLAGVRLVLAESPDSAERFRRLGAPAVAAPGNLKLAAPPLVADAAELARLSTLLGARPRFVAASTHPGEEAIVAEALASLRRRWPDLICVLAPRHPDRGAELAALLRGSGLAVAQRSAGQSPDAASAVLLADTLGELGLVYRLAGMAFIGGSLVPKGGQNLLEPARLGRALLAGPHLENFAQPAQHLERAGALRRVADAASLAAAVARWLEDPAALATAAAAAEAAARTEAGVLQAMLQGLAPLLERAG